MTQVTERRKLTAIRKVIAAHPASGSHLLQSVRTGTFCCYTPEKEQIWHV